MDTALTIAGSDSSGGAGIQADLKTFAACGVYGLSAVTAITAQNTLGINAWEPVSSDLVTAQIEAVAQDPGVGAAKTGMLPTAAIVEAVAASIAALELPNLVVDPVMVSSSGQRLLDDEAAAAMKAELLKLAEIVTPNIPEAEVLAAIRIGDRSDLRRAAERIRALGPRVVVITGGHARVQDHVIDYMLSDEGEEEIRGPRIETRHTHGTGCTFSAAIAAHLARGRTAGQAVRAARAYMDGALRHPPGVGRGRGPLGHFWAGILK